MDVVLMTNDVQARIGYYAGCEFHLHSSQSRKLSDMFSLSTLSHDRPSRESYEDNNLFQVPREVRYGYKVGSSPKTSSCN